MSRPTIEECIQRQTEWANIASAAGKKEGAVAAEILRILRAVKEARNSTKQHCDGCEAPEVER